MPPSVKRWRWLVVLVVYLVVLGGGWTVGRWLVDITAIDLRPSNEPMVHAAIIATAGIFIVASATPFVPGAEIGFGMLVVFGANLALLVYMSMVAALLLAYLVGRLIPASVIASVFEYCGLTRAHHLVMKMTPLDPQARLALLTTSAPSGAASFLLRHRYLALIVLLNVPGNSIVGGGGGIALTAGMSGLFPFPAYLMSILLAVAPVPLFFTLGQKSW